MRIMKDLKKLIGVLILVCFSFGCGMKPPQPDFCALYSPTNAECNPTKPDKPVYELETIDMLGYQCISPIDFKDIKVFLKEVTRQLDKGTLSFASQVSKWP